MSLLAHELNTIYDEYHLYFTSCSISTSPGNEHIDVITTENISMRVKMDAGGWYSDNSRRYETFESLMMAKLPGFAHRFNLELMARLNKVARGE